MKPRQQPSELPPGEIRDIVNELLGHIRQHRVDKVQEVLALLSSGDADQVLLHTDSEGETLLHVAVKVRCPTDIVLNLVDACPDLLVASRNDSTLYRGQTALHIAITGRNITLTSCLLEKAAELGQGIVNDLLNTCATGSKFENTVMLGELPLIVAALTLKHDIFDKLLEFGAKLEGRNTAGDNVIHNLIKYAFLYPEKVDGVLKMCDYVAKMTSGSVMSVVNPTAVVDTCEDGERAKRTFQIWLSKNNDFLNPLQLSAFYGQHSIFKFIMEMKGVYCYVNSEDGLFDVALYDVTDTDTIQKKRSSNKVDTCDKSDKNNALWLPGYSSDITDTDTDEVYKTPTLEMMFTAQPGVVFKFIEMSPLRYVINKKWAFYRWFYTIWGCLHMLFMIGFDIYAIRRSELYTVVVNNVTTYKRRRPIGESGFETFYLALSVVIASLYLCQEVVRILRGEMAWSKAHIMNCYHNGPFRIILVTFSIVVFADFIWVLADGDHKDHLLVCAMILGWWFLVFFLRGFRQFSFFTVMIQKVLVGDMFRFSIVITMELIAFTGALFIAFRGSETTEENVYSYSKLLVMMFKMMFGFTSLEVLFDTRDSWFTVGIYVAFVILTYVLMINSLIAMMSNTCSVISQNRDMQFRVQQLSIILFFESVFPMSWRRLAGTPRICDWYDCHTNCFTKRKRYFMEVKSLHEVTKSKTRHRPNPDTMLETIFNTIQQIPTFFNSDDTPVEVVRDAVDSVPEPRAVTEEPPEESRSRSRSHKKKKKKKKSRRPEEPDIEEEVDEPPPGASELINPMFF